LVSKGVAAGVSLIGAIIGVAGVSYGYRKKQQLDKFTPTVILPPGSALVPAKGRW
jgi:hypothetical protein